MAKELLEYKRGQFSFAPRFIPGALSDPISYKVLIYTLTLPQQKLKTPHRQVGHSYVILLREVQIDHQIQITIGEIKKQTSNFYKGEPKEGEFRKIDCSGMQTKIEIIVVMDFNTSNTRESNMGPSN